MVSWAVRDEQVGTERHGPGGTSDYHLRGNPLDQHADPIGAFTDRPYRIVAKRSYGSAPPFGDRILAEIIAVARHSQLGAAEIVLECGIEQAVCVSYQLEQAPPAKPWNVPLSLLHQFNRSHEELRDTLSKASTDLPCIALVPSDRQTKR